MCKFTTWSENLLVGHIQQDHMIKLKFYVCKHCDYVSLVKTNFDIHCSAPCQPPVGVRQSKRD
jgi:hypothetical protein